MGKVTVRIRQVKKWKDTGLKKARELERLAKLLTMKNQYEQGHARRQAQHASSVSMGMKAHSHLAAAQQTIFEVAFVRKKQKRADNEEDGEELPPAKKRKADDDEDRDADDDEEERDASEEGTDEDGEGTAAVPANAQWTTPTSSSKGFGFVDSESESSNSTMSSAPEPDEPEEVSETKLRASLQALKGKMWEVGGVNLAIKMRRMQRAMLARLEKTGPIIETAATLISENCLVITAEKPKSYFAFSDDEWVAVRGAFAQYRLKLDHAYEAYAHGEVQRMLTARDQRLPYRALIRGEGTQEDHDVALLLDQLNKRLRTTKPDRGVHEATWCCRYMLPYFDVLSPEMVWKYDNGSHYGPKRPDFSIADDKGIGLANFEVKSPWATDAAKYQDIARTIHRGIDEMKLDLQTWRPKRSPARLCVAVAAEQGTVFQLMLHKGIFVAVEIGVWWFPTALQMHQEWQVASSVAMACAIMKRAGWVRRQAAQYVRLGVNAPRLSILPPVTPVSVAKSSAAKGAAQAAKRAGKPGGPRAAVPNPRPQKTSADLPVQSVQVSARAVMKPASGTSSKKRQE
ncbi:uncharacterized protein EV422DRAFT_507545 [Fimicolochytrium jonesii]|uniref:uncharacterized protein n=1 Tax=Fimicolochytrium jonesii TaxID=1396493 RepID=UPI0022FE1FBD|nr:uncharacterized protein EV422DRAFT_507545 [Fimicolochytrium jonesii]KAI8819503.1 hypothetical protein EV422DRAFT_507545 [Fimicolochytrium jonesii]